MGSKSNTFFYFVHLFSVCNFWYSMGPYIFLNILIKFIRKIKGFYFFSIIERRDHMFFNLLGLEIFLDNFNRIFVLCLIQNRINLVFGSINLFEFCFKIIFCFFCFFFGFVLIKEKKKLTTNKKIIPISSFHSVAFKIISFKIK